jgi:hypothetical protein
MDKGFDIPWVEGQNTMGKGVRYTMGMGDQNTMVKGVKIPWVEFHFGIYCYNALQN